MKTLLIFLLVGTLCCYTQAKTTDELINDVEDLLNKAPDAKKKNVVLAAATKIKPSALPAKMPTITPLAPQSAAVSGMGMRFQQMPQQQGVANSPFGGAQVNLAQGGSAYTALQGSRMLNSVMNMGGSVPPQQQQQIPTPQQQEMQMMQQQHIMAQQQMGGAMPGMPQQQPVSVADNGRVKGWQPPPSKETNLNIPSSGIPAPSSLIETTSTNSNRETNTNRHAWSPEVTVNSLYQINKNKIAKNLPEHLDQEVAPQQQQQQMDLLETYSKVHVAANAHSKLRHHARHHTRHRMRHHARHHHKMFAQNQAAKEEAAAYMDASAFGYGRAKEVGSSFGIRSFGERTNPTPVRATPAVQQKMGQPGRYSKVNEIAKAEAWERSQKAKNILANAAVPVVGAAPAPRQQQKIAPLLQPRFREIFPQQANDVSPFYRAHMAGNNNNANNNNDIQSLHSSLNALEKIPDVSRHNDNERFKNKKDYEHLVQNIDLSAVAEKPKQTAAASDKRQGTSQSANVVSKPEYDNEKASAKVKSSSASNSDASTMTKPTEAAVSKVDAPHHIASHHRPHSQYHKRATALMRFNRIKAGTFKPTSSHIVWHNWVSKSKERVKERIKSAILNYTP